MTFRTVLHEDSLIALLGALVKALEVEVFTEFLMEKSLAPIMEKLGISNSEEVKRFYSEIRRKLIMCDEMTSKIDYASLRNQSFVRNEFDNVNSNGDMYYSRNSIFQGREDGNRPPMRGLIPIEPLSVKKGGGCCSNCAIF